MNNALTAVTFALAAVFTVAGAAKLLAVAPMRVRAAHVGFSVEAYRGIGVLELAGALGLLVGGALPFAPTAAAGGLLLLLVGAVAAHRRAGDGLKEATPALVLIAALTVVLVLTGGELR